MALLITVSCLLFFTTYFTGIFTGNMLKRWLAIPVATNFFETFILGLITSFIYFNLLSFFAPVNYITLLPLLLVSIFIFSKKTVRQHFFAQVRYTTHFFFSKEKWLFVFPFIAVLFVYWIIPPLNWDSGEYHYISIRWYEQFRIVPGLGNVHGRLAFNPANFIISSAWSFTDVAGQPLYPLNGVLAFLFFTWFTRRFFLFPGSLYSVLILIISILLFRIILANVSSPSSDLLSGMLLFYCGFRTYELLQDKKNAWGDYFPVLLIACFSVTAKLSAIPSLLILPFIYFMLIKKNKQAGVIIKTLLLMALIILPWLLRNFLLSGYFLYPVPGSNIFHADWAVPPDVLKLDYLFSYYGPRTSMVDFFTMQKMNMPQLIKTWFMYMYNSAIFSLLIAMLAIFSPCAWLVFPLLRKKIPVQSFLLWCIYYLCVLVWLINSPEHRFGLAYMVLAITLPVFEIIKVTAVNRQVSAVALSAAMCAFCIYYGVSVFKKHGFYYFSVTDCWLKPLRDYKYDRQNNINTFSSVDLGNGIKLYMSDDDHKCLNANGPCMSWRYGTIQMRGKKIEDGFRNTKDEVKKYFPFVDAGK